MGSHPKAVNHENLERAIQNFRFLEDFTGKMIKPFEVECRVQVICTTKSEALDWKTATRAAHLYVAIEAHRRLFIRFLRMFSKRNELGFPLGQELWFVTSTTDSRIVQTQSRVLNATKM